MIWTMEAKVGKYEIEIQAKYEVQNREIHKKIDITKIHNFVAK